MILTNNYAFFPTKVLYSCKKLANDWKMHYLCHIRKFIIENS